MKELDRARELSPEGPDKAVPTAKAAVEALPAGIGYLYLITLVAAVGGFLFGYDLSLISGAILFLEGRVEPVAVLGGGGHRQRDPRLSVRSAGRRLAGRHAGQEQAP